MEPLGFFDIIKLTNKTILNNFKHFLCIAFLLAFNLPVFNLSSFALETLVGFLIALYKLIASNGRYHPSLEVSPNDILNDTPTFTQLAQFSSLLPFIIPLLATPLLTFSTYRACLNKSLDLKGSLLAIPKSAKNFILTSLCVSVAELGYYGMMTVMMGIIMGVELVVNANLATRMVMSCTHIGMAIGWVYLTVTFSLAHIVAVLEGKRGWEAMKISMCLLDGSKWLAFGLACLSFGILIPIEAAVLWRWRGGRIVQVSLHAFVELYRMAALVVLYLSCKSRRQESLNTLIDASSEFGPSCA